MCVDDTSSRQQGCHALPTPMSYTTGITSGPQSQETGLCSTESVVSRIARICRKHRVSEPVVGAIKREYTEVKLGSGILSLGIKLWTQPLRPDCLHCIPEEP